MNNLIGVSSATSGKTKNELIQQAHEARQSRELARRHEKAAILIQAYLKSVHVRRKLITETCKELEDIIKLPAFPKNKNILLLLRRLLFACDTRKNRTTLDSLLQFVLTSSKTNDIGSEHDYANLLDLMMIDRTSLNQWIEVLDKLINLCLIYLDDADSTRLDSQHIDTYLQLINLFTSKKSLFKLVKIGQNETTADITKILDNISEELLKRTLAKQRRVFTCTTNLIRDKINRFRNDLKTSVLNEYAQLALKLLNLEDSPSDYDEKLSEIKENKSNGIIIGMLSIPGLIHSLEKYANRSLKQLIESNLCLIAIKLLTNEQDIQKLTSTDSLCLLANLVHLATLSDDLIALETTDFVVVTTRLLDSCQRNMIQKSSDAKVSSSTAKKQTSMATFYNPILGWLSREQETQIDGPVIKSQLSHLWTKKTLKTLFNDLIKASDKITALHDGGNKSQLFSHSSPRHKSFIFNRSNTDNQSICDTSPLAQSIGLFKRAVERATTTMTKSINSSYVKTTGGSSNSAATKLLTPEAGRISSVCYMLHKTLKTLKTLKQDILTGLCLHDFILLNLWTYISSLSSHNGLKAFLEHLTIYTKTCTPEYYTLILFCECASHLISILDDSELYEKQQPFKLEDLVAISTFMNQFVFRILCNNLVPLHTQEIDPVLQASHKLLTDLYKRDCRRKFTPQDHWLIKDIKMSIFLKDLEAGKSIAKTLMVMLPHIIPHKERVLIFRKYVSRDKTQNCTGPSTLITIHRSRIVEDGYQQLVRLQPSALKGLIRVKFINDYGLDEAGIDQDGVFKEFLEDTIKRVFDPALNLFCTTSEQRLYPSPTSRLHEDYLSLFTFVGKMVGKAIYEGIVIDVPFASFFLSRVLGQPQSPLYSPIDELPSLDPELYKNLTYVKHYDGDVSELDLTFSIDQDFMGKIETHELEPGGRSIPVTRENRVRYIHSVANFRMKTQIEKQTEAFVNGFKSIINIEWLSMFSASEFQRLISGDETPIDLQDLRRHTKYFGGFHNNHRVICWLWDILEKDFTTEELSLFLKFVTSCSKPPLLGFANLEPPFSIRCVEVSDDLDLGDTVGSVLRGFLAIRRSDPVDRLPTSSTCFNLLKLPNYQRRSTLRDKMRYAIRSNPGFELS